MSAILPTKGALMAAKRSRALASTGYELMDRKRNILIREMMSLMDTAKEVQTQIDTVFAEAYAALQHANVKLGICDKITEAVEVDRTLEIQYRSIMGVELPHLPDRSPPPGRTTALPPPARRWTTPSSSSTRSRISSGNWPRWKPPSTGWRWPSARPRSGPMH